MADLSSVEQQRQTLEDSLTKLRQNLKTYHTWAAEYEGLKEELFGLTPPVDDAKIVQLSKSYEGELVTEKVVLELAGLDKGSRRAVKEIARNIEHRQDYVQKNIETLQRQFFDVESRLETFDFASSRDAETGLPLTEIEEELDDDDNVISSKTHQPEQTQTQLLEDLRKAGLTKEDLEDEQDLEELIKAEQKLKPAITNASSSIPSTPVMLPVLEKRKQSIDSGDATVDTNTPRPPIRKKSVSFTVDTKAAPDIARLESEDGRKSVSFADKVAIAPAAPPPDSRTVQFSPQIEEIPPQPLGPGSPVITASTGPGAEETERQKELRATFKPGDRVKTIADDDTVVSEDIVMPENETEEDAEARREMLQYHLHEVGHVVAQMDLDGLDEYDDEDDDDADYDDTSSRFTGSTRMEDEDTPYTSAPSDDEDEDAHGRAKGKVISDDYRHQMLEMQQRLIGNMGPTPHDVEIADLDSELDPKDVRKLVIRDKRSSVSSASSESSGKAGSKKRVSFAEELDVAEPGSPPLKAQKRAEEAIEPAVPVAERVAERRTSATSHSMPAKGTPMKASRFMKARGVPAPEEAVASPEVAMEDDDAPLGPLGPPGKTLADQLVERDTASTRIGAPSAESADVVTERRQLAAEYYKRRDDMVRQQGGFKVDRDEEEELGELMEERDGKVKKVSRFKAARIKP